MPHTKNIPANAAAANAGAAQNKTATQARGPDTRYNRATFRVKYPSCKANTKSTKSGIK